jgi:hypothetical protein
MKASFDFDPNIYGPVFKELLKEKRLSPLGPGSPNDKALSTLSTLTIDKAFSPHEVLDADMAKACIAAVWLYHDYLQESHEVSQTIHTQVGSYWHGIMHRRGQDFNNSKYWFRQVREHPIFEPLRISAKELTSRAEPHKSTEFLLKQLVWDPIAFISLCEACIKGRSPGEMLCRQIQQKEWELLFDYCYRQAIML